ncbi:MAG: hypothetical protein IJW59_01480 [Clostridia bacterium]|nr:hypothetical protein [Clostridia bacterium]
MNKNIAEYINYIQNLTNIIKNGENEKKEALAAYWKKIEDINAQSNDCNAKIDIIKGFSVTARLTDVVKHLAEQWGTSIDNIGISNYTNCRCVVSSVEDFNAVLESKLQRGGVKINYFIHRTDLDLAESARNSVTIEQTVRMGEPQADWRTFREHTVVQGEPSESKYVTMDLVVNDYNDILISSKLKDLLYYSSATSNFEVAQSPFAKAMVAAVEDYEAEKSEQEIGE